MALGCGMKSNGRRWPETNLFVTNMLDLTDHASPLGVHAAAWSGNAPLLPLCVFPRRAGGAATWRRRARIARAAASAA
jgi:hypothetical protein